MPLIFVKSGSDLQLKEQNFSIKLCKHIQNKVPDNVFTPDNHYFWVFSYGLVQMDSITALKIPCLLKNVLGSNSENRFWSQAIWIFFMTEKKKGKKSELCKKLLVYKINLFMLIHGFGCNVGALCTSLVKMIITYIRESTLILEFYSHCFRVVYY